MDRSFAFALAIALALALGGCGTVAGVGKDIEAVGGGVSGAAVPSSRR